MNRTSILAREKKFSKNFDPFQPDVTFWYHLGILLNLILRVPQLKSDHPCG